MQGGETSFQMSQELVHDWRVPAICQFAHIFKTQLSLDDIQPIELEHSIAYPEEDGMVGTLLYKLIEKKVYKRKDAKEPDISYTYWNELLAKKLSSMYRKYKRLLSKYNSYAQGPKEPMDPKWSDNLIEDVIKYKGDRRPIKKFLYYNYAELSVENLQYVRFFTQFDGKNPLCPEQTGVPMAEHSSLEAANQEQNLISKKFHEIPCADRVKILYHFCLIRSLQGDKDPTQVGTTTPTAPPSGTAKPTKRVTPIGTDKNGNEYYNFQDHKDGRVYKLLPKSIRHTTEDIAECFTPVDNVKKLIAELSGTDNKSEKELKKVLTEKLPTLEELDKETQTREQIRVRKLQSLNRSKKVITNAQKQYADAYKTEVPLINLISNTVMTRTQLQNLKNRLTKPLTAEDLLKERYERQKLERQRRLERRQKKDYVRKHYNKYEWMNDSDLSASYGDRSSKRKKRIKVELAPEDEQNEEEDAESFMELIDDEEPEDTKIELFGEIWVNFGATYREILIKGKWKLTSFEEESDFEYQYFKEFDKTLGLPPSSNPVFAIEKDYSTLVKRGVKAPPFDRSEFHLKNIPKLFGGVYRGWFNYNGQILNEFSSMNFLPVEGGETPNSFSIEGDGHNSIGVYILDGAATFNFEEQSEEGGEMIKIGDIHFYKYYSSLKEMNEPLLIKGVEGMDDISTNRVSLKIRNRPVFDIVKLTVGEAREVRKVLPQFT